MFNKKLMVGKVGFIPTTFNPSTLGGSYTLSSDKLTLIHAAGLSGSCKSYKGVSSGKYYWEFTAHGSQGASGIALASHGTTVAPGQDASVSGYGYLIVNGKKIHLNSQAAYGATYATTDNIGIALDMDNGAVYWSKNGTWQNSGDPTSGASKTGAAYTGLSGTYYAMAGTANGTITSDWTVNFGASSFAYSVPSGYIAGLG